MKRRRQLAPRQQQFEPLPLRRAAESTLEAVALSLRGGVTALEKPDTLRRLSELGDEQLRSVMVRLQKFEPHIARAWASEEIAVLLAIRGRIHGRQNP